MAALDHLLTETNLWQKTILGCKFFGAHAQQEPKFLKTFFMKTAVIKIRFFRGIWKVTMRFVWIVFFFNVVFTLFKYIDFLGCSSPKQFFVKMSFAITKIIKKSFQRCIGNFCSPYVTANNFWFFVKVEPSLIFPKPAFATPSYQLSLENRLMKTNKYV